MPSGSARRLARLMMRERAMLLRADIRGLGAILPEKARLIEQLAADDVDEAGLRDLRRAAMRNDALYEAVMAGIDSVRTRIEALRQGVPGGTYGNRGQKTDISPAISRLHRRA